MLEFLEFEEPSLEDWLKYCQGKLRKHPPWRKWHLRTNVRTANRLFDCDECYIPILPGDSYTEEVYACNGKIEVKRYHWPECPHDPWDEDELEKDNFENVPKIVPFYAPWRQAA